MMLWGWDSARTRKSELEEIDDYDKDCSFSYKPKLCQKATKNVQIPNAKRSRGNSNWHPKNKGEK